MKASKKIELLRNHKIVRNLLELYIEDFGDTDVHVFRIPARVNILGTHIDHRGGYVNYLSINREFCCIAGKRADRKIKFHDANKQLYAPGEFEIDRELPDSQVEWFDFIRRVKLIPGEYQNYIKAAVLYLQNAFPQKKLCGMNLVGYGEIPVGAGLSSSSAVVVGVMLSACRLNNISIEKGRLAEMCGQAEWYVGTRGGSGDHAAMIFGRENKIAHMQFSPFSVKFLPFPPDYRIISCNSLIEAKKSAGAKDIFNSRITSYEIGFRLVKKNFPSLAPKLTYLRDINPQNLGNESIIYDILLSLPETLSRKEAMQYLPDENLDFLFESHVEPQKGYKIRDVVLYGISECERSRICEKFLRDNDMDSFGKLMFISHDGDRVSQHLPNGQKCQWDFRVSNEYLTGLKEDINSGCSLRKEKAALYNQPGAYRCSTEELDLIVDIAKNIRGVKGAKLTGAGLGGSVLILVEKDQTERVIDILDEKYYKPKGFLPSAFVCKSVNGAEEI